MRIQLRLHHLDIRIAQLPFPLYEPLRIGCQMFGHGIKAFRQLPEFVTAARFNMDLIVALLDLTDRILHFPDRFIDQTADGIGQHKTGEQTEYARNGRDPQNILFHMI